MNVGVFLTYDYSLKTLSSSGILIRELKLYQEIHNKFGTNFTIFTYGDIIDEELLPSKSGISVFPIYKLIKKNKNKYFRVIKSLLIPFLIRKDIKNIDILHQHQLNGVWIPLICKALYKKPLYMRTGYDAYSFSIKDNDNKLLQFFYKFLTILTLKFSDLYTVTSKTDLEFLTSNFSFNENKIVVRPNWVTIPEVNKKFQVFNKVLSVGRLVKQKNFSLLIKEMKKINSITLDIVGAGPLEKELRDLSTKEGVLVNFLGTLDYENLQNLYNDYTFYISTSSFEGNPKTILEAMASGCVVIASDIESHREIITNDFNGKIFDKNNPNLIKLLDEFINNPDKVSFCSKNAIESVKKYNSLDKIVVDTYSDYEQL